MFVYMLNHIAPIALLQRQSDTCSVEHGCSRSPYSFYHGRRYGYFKKIDIRGVDDDLKKTVRVEYGRNLKSSVTLV